MEQALTIAVREFRDGLRNRWVLATTLLLAALALSLALAGSVPTGSVKVSPLIVTLVSLASLSVFLVPLIALLLSYDAIVGEAERGTLALLLSYPVARWQVVFGKFAGHVAILAFATVLGYGAAGVAVALTGETGAADWRAFAGLIGSSILLGAVFIAFGYVVSVATPQRATAGGIAVAVWLVFVLLYDTALLGALIALGGDAAIPVEAFNLLLLANPAEVFRLYNLTGAPEAAVLSGMTGVGAAAGFGRATLTAALIAWALVPLAFATLLFQRKEV